MDRCLFAKARFYDPEVGRFISQDSFLGQVDDPPSLHRYFYANANPTFYTDPTGQYSWSEFKSDAKWGKDFIVAFGSDLAQNAPARAGKIAEATARNAVNMAKETGANIHDAAVLSYEVATGTDTGIGLRSSAAQQAGARMAAGESAGSITKDILGNTAANVATFGIYSSAKEQYGALRDFSQGKASISDVENRLADAAGGSIVNLGVTATFLKGTTGSVKGPDLGAAAKTVVEGVSQLPSPFLVPGFCAPGARHPLRQGPRRGPASSSSWLRMAAYRLPLSLSTPIGSQWELERRNRGGRGASGRGFGGELEGGGRKSVPLRDLRRPAEVREAPIALRELDAGQPQHGPGRGGRP